MDPVTLTRAQVWKARVVGGLVGIVVYGLVCLAASGLLARTGAGGGPLAPDRLPATMAVVFALGVPLMAWIFAQGGPQIAEGWAPGRARRGQPVTRDPARERAAVVRALALMAISLAMLAVGLVIFVVATVGLAQAYGKPLVVTRPAWLVAWAGGLSGGARLLVEIGLGALLYGGTRLVRVIARDIGESHQRTAARRS